jgi:hypothetical protein
MLRPRAPEQRMSAPEHRMRVVVKDEGEVGRASGVVLSGPTLWWWRLRGRGERSDVPAIERRKRRAKRRADYTVRNF